MKRLIIEVISAWLCLSVAACSTMRSVPLWRESAAPGGTDPAQCLQVGDVVRVTTKSAAEVDLVVTAIEDDAVVGTRAGSPAPERFLFDDIVRVERKQFDTRGTVLLGASGAVLVVGLVVAALLRLLGGIAFMPSGPS